MRKQVTEERLPALRLTSPECAHIWRCTTAWMTSALMVKYVRLLGRCLKDFRASHRFVLFLRCTSSSRQSSCSACCGSCRFVGMCDSRQTHMGLAAMRHAFVCYRQTRFKRRGAAEKWDDSERRTKLGDRVGGGVARCSVSRGRSRLGYEGRARQGAGLGAGHGGARPHD